MICAEIADQRVVRDSCLRTVRPPIGLATPPVGDEVAPFSAARNSDVPATSAMVTPRAFGCGCAALRFFGDSRKIEKEVKKSKAEKWRAEK